MMMQWLPPLTNFRDDLRSALEAADRLQRLAALAQHRLGFLETIQLDRAIGRGDDDLPSGFSRVRLALLGSATLDHLKPPIRVAGLRRRLVIDVHVGSYAQYRQELLDPASPVHEFAPQIVLLSLTARDVVGQVPVVASAAEAEAAVARGIENIRVLWRTARESLKSTVLQQTVLDISEPLFGSYDRLVPGAPARLVARLNERLCEAAAEDGVLLVDVARMSERDGRDAWFDMSRWLQAKQEIAPQAAPLYGDLVARIIAAQRGLSRKCLVLDLDNTLWGGVVGDDGLDGIVLGEGSAAGEAYLALQRYAKQLKDRGIILAVCSKNDPAIADAAFRDHSEMILKRSDFAAFAANWNDKAENLKAIAAQLNIGIDSLVFVDDNPVERARIRDALPAVAVPELPDDVAHYVRCLADAGYFEAISFTADDQQRADQYSANAERDAARGATADMGEFLQGLGMSVRFGPFTPTDLPRITQLINKTNQFNPTTRRYTADEVADFAAQPENITLRFRLLDRFGDNGLVSAMILKPVAEERGLYEIDAWVMSCRVFGRQLEIEAMSIAVEAARRRDVLAIRADYIPTPKNGVVGDLYPKLGFSSIDGADIHGGGTRWILSLDDYAAPKTHILRVYQ